MISSVIQKFNPLTIQFAQNDCWINKTYQPQSQTDKLKYDIHITIDKRILRNPFSIYITYLQN